MNDRSRATRARCWRAFQLASVVVPLMLASPAWGQSKEELAKARTLFREGVALSAANNWSGALTKFKAVAQVKMTAQVAFNIAECEEHLGQLLSALGNYRLASSEAQQPNANASDVAGQVGGRISALEARIPKLVIKRGEGAESAVIELDGTELGASQVGVEIAVDPGPHVVVGKVGGKEMARETATLAEKETKKVSIVIDLETAPKGGGTPDVKPDQPGPTQPDQTKPGSKVPGAVVTGLGVASLGMGVVFLIMRQGAISDLDAMCGGDDTCPPSAQDTADKGKLYTGLAEVGIGLGVVGVGAGIVLLVTAGKGSAAPAPAAPAAAKPGVRFIGAAPGASIGGASLVGRF